MSNLAGDLGTHPTHPYYNHGGTLGDSGHKNGEAWPGAGPISGGGSAERSGFSFSHPHRQLGLPM